jgi:hypothetical protein
MCIADQADFFPQKPALQGLLGRPLFIASVDRYYFGHF